MTSRKTRRTSLFSGGNRQVLDQQALHSLCRRSDGVQGTGYVEESILPRLYREAPLNGIWKGRNDLFDVLRTMQKVPEYETVDGSTV